MKKRYSTARSGSEAALDVSGPVTSIREFPYPVVGIGASAGGLDALQQLFAGIPATTGAAYIVVQHLSPDHKSMMAGLLARHTSMSVTMVESDMAIEPNKIYLIPPGVLMRLVDGRLHLTPKAPHVLTLPIDIFFQSLAEDVGTKAIAVILSGTGSDGTRGAAAINGAGGLLLAQDPENAKFDGMPRSVIATGLVDAVLPVDLLAHRIVEHVTQQPSPLQHNESGEEPKARSDQHVMAPMLAIMQLLEEIGGIDFNDYKPGTVTRRIERRMAVRQVTTIESYLEMLRSDRSEVQTLKREMLIPVTSFFRDTEAFQQLRELVIEPLVAAANSGQQIRVWCAGVSTGEEAYSVTMLLLEAFGNARKWPHLKVFATDVEQTSIETGAAGTYPESIATEVSGEQLERFFTKHGSHFVVKNELRQCILFARQNLLVDPPFTKMDLVICRNTLIYFRAAAQERVLRRLQYALKPGGYLFLGSSESLGNLQTDFKTISTRHKIWQMKRPILAPLDRLAAMGGVRGAQRPRRHADAAETSSSEPSLVDQGLAALSSAYVPAAILVNSSHDVLHAYGDVGRFLELREGRLSLRLSRMLPEQLLPVATALLFKTGRDNVILKSDVLKLEYKGDNQASRSSAIRLTSLPLGEIEDERYALLAFEEVNVKLPPDALTDPTIDVDAATAERLEFLERELNATRESLQATIEERETSNEELQATNEEMMASNEELQSSNEELQSVNEELNTVNAEYQEKIEILNRLNADLDNLAKVATSGTIFVDSNLHLTRYSQEAAHIFHLREGDIGRPLSDLRHDLDYPDFIERLTQAMTECRTIEKHVPGPEGKYFIVRMQPYRIPSSSSMGMVISCIDTTLAHQVNQLQKVIDAIEEQVVVLDTKGQTLLVNEAWQHFKDMRQPEAPGIQYGQIQLGDFCHIGENDQDQHLGALALQGLKSVLNKRTSRFSMEYPCRVDDKLIWFAMHIKPLPDPSEGAVVCHVNITNWYGAASDPTSPEPRADANE